MMSTEQATHALCNVHLLRELVYVEEVAAEQQQWTRPLAKLLLDIKAAVERAKEHGETKLSDEQLALFTARYDRLVKRAARLNPPRKAEQPEPLSKRYKVVRVKRRDPASPLIYRLETKREHVLRLMTDFRVPFDNNATERDIRMVKLQQKIGGCFRTPEGAEAFCRIRFYLSSARKQGTHAAHRGGTRLRRQTTCSQRLTNLNSCFCESYAMMRRYERRRTSAGSEKSFPNPSVSESEGRFGTPQCHPPLGSSHNGRGKRLLPRPPSEQATGRFFLLRLLWQASR